MRKVVVLVLVFVIFALLGYFNAASGEQSFIIEDFEAQEARNLQRQVEVWAERRNAFVAYLARKYGVDLKTHSYDVEAGRFVESEDEEN